MKYLKVIVACVLGLFLLGAVPWIELHTQPLEVTAQPGLVFDDLFYHSPPDRCLLTLSGVPPNVHFANYPLKISSEQSLLNTSFATQSAGRDALLSFVERANGLSDGTLSQATTLDEFIDEMVGSRVAWYPVRRPSGSIFKQSPSEDFNSDDFFAIFNTICIEQSAVADDGTNKKLFIMGPVEVQILDIPVADIDMYKGTFR